MLRELRIRHFAIIDQAEITFGRGLNIISGETGAGKSIIMDALQLILGGRASSDLIRKGNDEAVVEASFDISNDKNLQAKLTELAIPFSASDNDLIIKRIINCNGKNKIVINGSLANISTLAEITAKLVDLCSQHDQQLLAKPEEQLLWLDRFGNLDQDRQNISLAYTKFRTIDSELKQLSSDISEKDQKIDFLRFQLNEILEANLESPDEDALIAKDLKLRANAEHLHALSQECTGVFEGTDQNRGLLGDIGALMQKTKTLVETDKSLAELNDFLSTIFLNATEASRFVRDYCDRIEHDESKLEALHQRQALLSKLKRKYGPSLKEVFDTKAKIENDLASLENHGQSIERLLQQKEKAHQFFLTEAKLLSKKRKKVGQQLSLEIEKELVDLQMPKAKFFVEQSTELECSSGIDKIQFLISANPGESPGLLQKIASGGELSRVMLAIHNVLSVQNGVGVFLFDEVDAGIGGQTAAAVGSKIAKVASHNQVVCITHLPQVACFADHHLKVEKQTKVLDKQERTMAVVYSLDGEDKKIAELSRMLGGIGDAKAATANAKAMREKAKASRIPKIKSGKAREIQL